MTNPYTYTKSNLYFEDLYFEEAYVLITLYKNFLTSGTLTTTVITKIVNKHCKTKYDLTFIVAPI